MRILGFDITRKSLVQHTSSDMTQYITPTTGTVIDGRRISRSIRNYYSLYRSNTDLRRCVEEIVQTAGKGGYKFSKIQANGKIKPVTSERMESFFLSDGGWKKLRSKIGQQLLVGGSLFCRYRKNVRGAIIGVEVLDTRGVTVVTDEYCQPIRYLYSAPMGKRGIETYEVEDIMHYVMTQDIDNPVWGMSSVETLVIDLVSDEESALANLHFFANDAIPSSLYILEQNMSAEEKKMAIEGIKEKLSGWHNKHKILASDAIKDIKPLTQAHTDMDFSVLRKFTTDKVCAAMGVPKVILGYSEGVNYTNAQELYTKYIENTIRPYEDTLEDIVRIWMEKIGEVGISFDIVDEHVDDYDARSKTAERHVTHGLWSRNEARRYMGWDEVDDELMNAYTVQSTTVLLDSLPEMVAQIPSNETDEQD